eukprot:CAMPEP_0205999126 /NCGR_PEP_ID=MMETSP1464-20131121/662_1 /ASSEMBLY_ACC=CAM_ASM_001124 /TAXON_ID=119497 /ORGANISM="Exanthemachrysis gayraliae, Strain RCC1523" /LENGTH=440 /DNA_ID=CAMNT_0053372309 /DNA_START=1 /DNA_END=1324 /DNA_ORIENTATION=+
MVSELTQAADTAVFDVGGEEVSCHMDDAFSKLRRKYSVSNTFLKEFSFDSLKLFGGKGGNLMAFTANKRFLVKELSDGDHGSLLTHARAIVGHMTDGPTLIVPMFLHFTRPKNGRPYLVMLNCLPTHRGIIWHKRYDLKGNRDDKLMEEDGEDIPEVHKRCFAVHKCWYGCDVIPLCNTPARKRYYQGKVEAFTTTFNMSEQHAKSIVGAVKADTDLFRGLGLMDYSMICGIIKQGQSDPVPPAEGLYQFVLNYDGATYIYYLGIIDFLQEWTSTKVIAAALKAPLAPKPLSTVPPPKYADQFYSAMEHKFKAENAASSRVVIASAHRRPHNERACVTLADCLGGPMLVELKGLGGPACYRRAINGVSREPSLAAAECDALSHLSSMMVPANDGRCAPPGGAPLAAQPGDTEDGAAAAHGAGVLASSPPLGGGVEGIPIV